MNEIFNFHGQEVRTMTINDEPWFVGKDVADILGYSKARNAIALHVDEDDAEVRTRVSHLVNDRIHRTLVDGVFVKRSFRFLQEFQKRRFHKGITLGGNAEGGGNCGRRRGAEGLQDVFLLKNRGGILHQLLTLCRQLHASAVPGQKFHIQFVLQLLKGRGDAGLRNEQLTRGFVDRAGFGDFHEVT